MRETVEKYWTAAEARDWVAFGELLAEEVVYELPQTRERITGKADYLRFNEEYPGDWHVALHRVVAEGRAATSWIKWASGEEGSDAVTFFEFDGEGRIARITDFWPEAYEPPEGRGHLVERY